MRVFRKWAGKAGPPGNRRPWRKSGGWPATGRIRGGMGRAGTGRRTRRCAPAGERRAVAAAQDRSQPHRCSCGRSLRGPRRSARRKASPLVSAKPLAQALEPLQAISRANGASGSVSRPSPRRPSSAWWASACARFGRSTPCQGSGAGCRRHGARPARPGLPGKRCRAGRAAPPRRPSPGPAGVAAGRRDDSTHAPADAARPPPARHAAEGNPGAPARPPARVLRPAPATGGASASVAAGRVREQVEQRQHQGLARSAGNAARGRSRAGQPASPNQRRGRRRRHRRARCHGDVRASPGLRRRPAGWRTWPTARGSGCPPGAAATAEQPAGASSDRCGSSPAAGLSIRLRTSSAPARDPCRGPRPASSRRRTSRSSSPRRTPRNCRLERLVASITPLAQSAPRPPRRVPGRRPGDRHRA